jgi:hypothetical protein
MNMKEMDAICYYRHNPEEVEELSRALIPMMEHVRAVSSGFERGTLKLMLGGEFFRLKDANKVKAMLVRAVKHSRATLCEYFPSLQHDVLVNAQLLEDATNRYWRTFDRLREETLPTH